MLTVACVLVRGNVPFTQEYVHRLQSMVSRSLSSPHRFVCLSDQEIQGVETIAVPTPQGMSGWWSKLELFNRARGLTGKVLYLDLDVLVVSSLEPVVSRVWRDRISLVPDAGNWSGRDGLRVVKRFNSSVMLFDAGKFDFLYDSWSPAEATRLWGDQDWIGEVLPGGDLMPLSWFPRLSEINVRSVDTFGRQGIPVDAKVVLCKKPKNHVAAAQWPWFDRMWR